MKNCKLHNCNSKHYAKGLCRSHYRQQSGEHKRRWEHIKSEPGTHEEYKSYMREWFKYYKRDYKQHADTVYFDGNREKAIERDGFQCTLCGITREEHRERYEKDLNVHHVDGKGFGRKKADRNSELENLLTVCVRCHTLIHKGVNRV